MANQHREFEDESSSSLFLPSHDDHYNNEHSSRRPRLALPPMRTTPRYVGDGYDFRRPVMSAGGVTSAAAAAPVIDLTDDDNMQDAENEGSQGTLSSDAVPAQATAGSSSRATRLPRFGGRDIINLAETLDGGVDEGEQHQPARPALASNLEDLWGPRAERPQYSQLRRPARFNRQPTPVAASHNAAMDFGMDDDDLEIVAERPRSRMQTLSRQHTPSIPALHRSITPYPGDLNGDFVDLTEDTDDVVHLNTRPRSGTGLNAARPGTTAGVGTRSHIDEEAEPGGMGMGRIANAIRATARDQMPPRLLARLGLAERQRDLIGRHQELLDAQQRLGELTRGHMELHRGRMERHRANQQAGRNHRTVPAGAVGVPMLNLMMDYGEIGFDMPGARRDPSPKYEPPPEAEKGFTRNPGEDEVVVCPNCGDELAVTVIPGDAAREEVKQQVWAVKGCGHAYCGECAQNRARKVSKKGKGKATDALVMGMPAPFARCVVDGCGKAAGKSGMIQIYLGA